MRLKFSSRFEWNGLDVYSYRDLDTNETVWLKGGRTGKVIARFPKLEYSRPFVRAVDLLPSKRLIDYLKKKCPTPNVYKTGNAHDHWAMRKD
jgi:hypothetical protein